MALDTRKLGPGTTIQDDWDAATHFLHSNGYFCETIYTSSAKSSSLTSGLVFTHPTRLSVLSNHEYFTVFDSTHKGNVHGYNLFTFMCRNEYGI